MSATTSDEGPDSQRLETGADEREVTLALLRLIGQPAGLHDLMADVTLLMQHWSGCQAVGIRLRQGEDFPYFETRGFPAQFIQAENSLCAVDPAGNLIRDTQGNPVLECMCGNVICGRFDPSLPFFTANGSFWTNSTTKLLASTTEQDRQARTRNRCHGEGFQSVALIPLRLGQNTLGLFQFNDLRPDRFSPDTIALLERLADTLAIVIHQRLTDQALRESQDQLNQTRTMLAAVLDHTHMMAVYLDTRFNFIWVNPAYAATCGHEPGFFPGKNHFELYPHAENQAIFQQVVDTGQPFFVAAKPFTFPDQPERGVTYWDWSLIPVKDARGQVSGLVFTLAEVTDRVRSEQALRQSEARYRALYEGAAIGIFHSTFQGRFLDVNPALARMLGYGSPQEVVDSIYSIAEQIYASAPRRDEVLAQLLARGRTVTVENRYRRRDGTQWDAYLHLRHVLDAQGRPQYLEGFVEDITARKQAEASLREQNELLAAIRQAQDLFISGQDPGQVHQDLLHVLVQHTQSQFGFLDEVLYEPDGTPYKLSLALSDISWDEDSRRLYEELAARRLEFRNLDNLSGAPVLEGRTIIANDVPRHPRYRGLPQGHPPLTTYMGIPLYFENRIIGVAGVANRPGGYNAQIAEALQPLTQTCAAMIWSGRVQRREKQAREQLETVLNMNPDAAQITRLDDGCIVYVNNGVTALTGYAAAEMIGKTTLDIDLWDNPADRKNVLEELGQKGCCGNYEAIFKRKDGGRLVGLMSSRLFLYQGQPHVISVTRDITDRKRSQEQAYRLEKAESLGRMAGAVAHHFNNQLSVVLGNLDLALDDVQEGTETRGFVVEAMQAARRCVDLSATMLTCLGQGGGLPEPLDLGHVCRHCLPALRDSLPVGIVLETDLPAGGPVVRASAELVDQVLGHLITNAVEAIGERSGKVSLAIKTVAAADLAALALVPLEWQPRGERFACLQVDDTGCGMSAEDISNLYDPFFTTKFTGRGLGLPVVLGIVKAWDGAIGVESQKDRGTTFRVVLPLVAGGGP